MKNHFETPRLPSATKSQNPIFQEVHANEKGIVNPLSEKITETMEETRRSILEKYKISPKHALTDIPYAGQRKIRAFSILINKEDENQHYYNEGHVPHVRLFETILKRFTEEIGVDDILELDLTKWATKKGFLDPNQNGFRSFPETRQALLGLWNENKDINSPQEDLPNWFLSGDSENGKK